LFRKKILPDIFFLNIQYNAGQKSPVNIHYGAAMMIHGEMGSDTTGCSASSVINGWREPSIEQ
jgi:hypothetical protein